MGFSGDQTKVMKQIFFEISVKTKGQGLYDFTEETLNWLNEQKINNGIFATDTPGC